MRLAMTSLLPLLAAAAVAPAAYAATASWGRAGVSIEEYRADAVECARQGADRDIRDEEATVRVLAAERVVDRDLNLPAPGGAGDSIGDLRRRYQPDRRIAELQRLLVAETERCLRSRGYSPFVLTSAQDKHLRRLARGSAARRAYLHALARDPSVLAGQADPTPERRRSATR